MGALSWLAITLVAVASLLAGYSEFVHVPGRMALLEEVAASDGVTVLSGVWPLPLASPLSDPDTLIAFPLDVVRFQRRAEYCQWTEHTSNNQHSYSLIWSSTLINSAFFRDKSVEFRNPRPTRIEEISHEGQVAIQGHGVTTGAGNLLSVLPESTYAFSENDFALLKASPAYQRGFTNMDSRHIILDYSHFSSDHEFYKNLHRASQFLLHGEYNYGPSICTPGDIRVRYSVWRIQQDSEISVLGAREGDRVVPFEAPRAKEAVFLARSGRLDRRELVDGEAGNVLWWRNVWRAWLVVSVALAVWIKTKK